MSVHSIHKKKNKENHQEEFFKLDDWEKTRIGLAILAGAIALGYLLYKEPHRAWINFLVDHFYFVSMALSGGFILALNALANASWAVTYRRVLEAMTKYLPVAFVFSLIMIFGIHSLYEWSHHDIVAKDALLLSKSKYLNTQGYVIRTIVFFTIWILTTKMLRRTAGQLEETQNLSYVPKQIRNAAIFTITFAFSYSLASFDWIMSIEPHWFSTIFALYTFSGLFLGGLAFVTLTNIYLQHKGHLQEEITTDHYHDLGKFIFGFSTFWAYIWFSQFMLIWYSNIPEETQYFYLRFGNSWDWLFYINFVLNWIIPFFALMPRESKRSKFILVRVCVVLLVGRWLDIYLMVAPNVFKHHGNVGLDINVQEVAMALGFTGIFLFIFLRALSSLPLSARKDPNYEEAMHLHQ